MLKHPHRINASYATFLMLVGFVAYFITYFKTNSTEDFSALVPALLGIVFFPMTTQIKRGNRTIAHLAVALTLLVGGLMLLLYFRIDETLDVDTINQKRGTYAFVIIGSFVAIGLYGVGFLGRKKEE